VFVARQSGLSFRRLGTCTGSGLFCVYQSRDAPKFMKRK